jgi:hypothetical protein
MQNVVYLHIYINVNVQQRRSYLSNREFLNWKDREGGERKRLVRSRHGMASGNFLSGKR